MTGKKGERVKGKEGGKIKRKEKETGEQRGRKGAGKISKENKQRKTDRPTIQCKMCSDQKIRVMEEQPCWTFWPE